MNAFAVSMPALRSLRVESTLSDLITFAPNLPKLTHFEILLASSRRASTNVSTNATRSEPSNAAADDKCPFPLAHRLPSDHADYLSRPRLSLGSISRELTTLKIQQGPDMDMELSVDECAGFSRFEKLSTFELIAFEPSADAMGVLLEALSPSLRSFAHTMMEDEDLHRSAALDHMDFIAQKFPHLEVFDVCYDEDSKHMDVVRCGTCF